MLHTTVFESPADLGMIVESIEFDGRVHSGVCALTAANPVPPNSEEHDSVPDPASGDPASPDSKAAEENGGENPQQDDADEGSSFNLEKYKIDKEFEMSAAELAARREEIRSKWGWNSAAGLAVIGVFSSLMTALLGGYFERSASQQAAKLALDLETAKQKQEEQKQQYEREMQVRKYENELVYWALESGAGEQEEVKDWLVLLVDSGMITGNDKLDTFVNSFRVNAHVIPTGAPSTSFPAGSLAEGDVSQISSRIVTVKGELIWHTELAAGFVSTKRLGSLPVQDWAFSSGVNPGVDHRGTPVELDARMGARGPSIIEMRLDQSSTSDDPDND